MTETLTIRLDPDTKLRLDALARHAKRSKSFLAAEAISAYVKQEEWQLGEIQAGIRELNAGAGISHEATAVWLKSWGKKGREKSSAMTVVWSPRAIRHLIAIRTYIERDSDANAAHVAMRILEAVEILGTQPHLGRPGRLSGTRELVVAGTPYIIPYRVRRERLELLAVFDGRRQWPQ